MSPTSTNGAHSIARSSVSWSPVLRPPPGDGRSMTLLPTDDGVGSARPTRTPCFNPVARRPAPGPERIRVVEVLATGGNGGAQEHLWSLVTGLDPARFDVCVVSLSGGSTVRRLQ